MDQKPLAPYWEYSATWFWFTMTLMRPARIFSNLWNSSGDLWLSFIAMTAGFLVISVKASTGRVTLCSAGLW